MTLTKSAPAASCSRAAFLTSSGPSAGRYMEPKTRQPGLVAETILAHVTTCGPGHSPRRSARLRARLPTRLDQRMKLEPPGAQQRGPALRGPSALRDQKALTTSYLLLASATAFAASDDSSACSPLALRKLAKARLV